MWKSEPAAKKIVKGGLPRSVLYQQMEAAEAATESSAEVLGHPVAVQEGLGCIGMVALDCLARAQTAATAVVPQKLARQVVVAVRQHQVKPVVGTTQKEVGTAVPGSKAKLPVHHFVSVAVVAEELKLLLYPV